MSVRIIKRLTSIIAMGLFTTALLADVAPKTNTMLPEPPGLSAKAYYLFDANSGAVLAEQNADERFAPASLTKLMVSYLVSNALKSGSIHLDDKVPISEKAWKTGGSKMFVGVGEQVPVSELLQGIIVVSGNDATVAIAEYIGGNEETFANMMTKQAKALGMNNTNFVDSNGLPQPNHYSTAHDLGILAQRIIKDFPEDYAWYQQKSFKYNNITQPNRNRLLWRYAGADGLKTGHTEEAGYCLVASAQRDGMRLVSVVLNTPSENARVEDTEHLLNYGFRFYQTSKLYQAGQTLLNAKVWLGEKSSVAVGPKEDIYATFLRGQNVQPQIDTVLNSGIKAPLTKGQMLGQINILVNGKLIASEPLVALEDDPQAGFFKRMFHYIVMFFYKLFGKA